MFENVFLVLLAVIGSCLANNKLTVFYDSLSDTSRLFIVNQLCPLLQESTNLSLILVPYGKLNLDVFPDEETYLKNEMIKLHACVANEKELTDIEKLLIVECIMTSKIAPLNNLYYICMPSEETKKSVYHCANYKYDQLLKSNFDLVQSYHIRKLPFVLINDAKFAFFQNKIRANLNGFLQSYEFCKKSLRVDDYTCYEATSSSSESIHFVADIGFIIYWISMIF